MVEVFIWINMDNINTVEQALKYFKCKIDVSENKCQSGNANYVKVFPNGNVEEAIKIVNFLKTFGTDKDCLKLNDKWSDKGNINTDRHIVNVCDASKIRIIEFNIRNIH